MWDAAKNRRMVGAVFGLPCVLNVIELRIEVPELFVFNFCRGAIEPRTEKSTEMF